MVSTGATYVIGSGIRQVMGMCVWPKHFQIDVVSDCRLPPTPEVSTASMWAELNVLKL